MVNDNDTITLPREVVEQALDAFEADDWQKKLQVKSGTTGNAVGVCESWPAASGGAAASRAGAGGLATCRR